MIPKIKLYWLESWTYQNGKVVIIDTTEWKFMLAENESQQRLVTLKPTAIT